MVVQSAYLAVGGQAIPLFDYYMAPGVLQTFKKHLKQQIFAMFDYEDLKDNLNIEKMDKIISSQKHMDFETHLLYSLIPKQADQDRLKKNLDKCYNRAISLTDRDTYQAMEALVANLNTMHSRCGAQVPFSSLNYGTDTSPEGRMVIKNLLLAEEAGLGDGETPIFPIAIFKVKEGVNYNPTDPNYDMLQLACRVTSLRLFPNFAFLDAPFNKAFYKEGVPDSEVGYMGCVSEKEIIIYTIDSELYVECFAAAFTRISRRFGYRENGLTHYVDLNGNVEVYDSHMHSFVKMKKIIKNPDRKNWHTVTLSTGEDIYATADHPFYVVNKGRTLCENLVPGDEFIGSDINFDRSRFEQMIIHNETIEKIYVQSVVKNDYVGYSYDVETESDMFDVSGILSHNCRTRVMTNVYSKRKEVISGRGNLSFTTINLPRLGIKYGIALGAEKADMDGFFTELEQLCDLVKDQLLERYKLQARKKVKNFPFLMGAGVWQDSEKLNPEDTLEKVLKHGTLTIGFIGLSECLIALTGKHHGESPISQELGLLIIKFMREKCDSYCEKYKMNFSLIATPAEGLSGRFIKIDRERFGVIPRITDKEYYTNSNHVDVKYPISVKEKLAIEAPYHELTNGGHIAYVELDGLTAANPEAIMQVVRMMHDAGVGYGAINHPVDRDPVCGYTGIIGDVCPRCGRRDGEEVPLDLVAKYKGSIYHHYKMADKPNIFDPTTPNMLDVPDVNEN